MSLTSYQETHPDLEFKGQPHSSVQIEGQDVLDVLGNEFTLTIRNHGPVPVRTCQYAACFIARERGGSLVPHYYFLEIGALGAGAPMSWFGVPEDGTGRAERILRDLLLPDVPGLIEAAVCQTQRRTIFQVPPMYRFQLRTSAPDEWHSGEAHPSWATALSEDQQKALQAIFDHFAATATWPSFRRVHKSFVRANAPVNLQLVLTSLPGDLAWSGSILPDQELSLGVEHMILCPGAENVLADFAKFVRLSAEMYIATEDTDVVITDQLLRAELGLSTHSVRQIGQILVREGYVWRSLGGPSEEGGLSVTLGDDIHWFRNAQSIEDYREAKTNLRRSKSAGAFDTAQAAPEPIVVDVPTVSAPNQVANSSAPMVDFVIITALKVEREAVCGVLGLTPDDREPRESRQYWRGRLQLKNGEFYQIVVAQSLDAGNVDASLLASDAIHHWQPSGLLMVGIAAAARDEQALGDVVVAKEILYFERGKETPTGKLPEPIHHRVDATLLGRAMSAPDWDGLVPVPRPDSTKASPQVAFGVVAAGERVIADRDLRNAIVSSNRRILAIDMEDYGVSAAVWQCFQQVRHLIVRGLCDHGDWHKNDHWHRYAAATAAGFAKHLLLDRPLEPTNGPP